MAKIVNSKSGNEITARTGEVEEQKNGTTKKGRYTGHLPGRHPIGESKTFMET